MSDGWVRGEERRGLESSFRAAQGRSGRTDAIGSKEQGSREALLFSDAWLPSASQRYI